MNSTEEDFNGQLDGFNHPGFLNQRFPQQLLALSNWFIKNMAMVGRMEIIQSQQHGLLLTMAYLAIVPAEYTVFKQHGLSNNVAPFPAPS